MTEIEIEELPEIPEKQEPEKPEVKAFSPIAMDPHSQLMIARDNSELYRMVTTMMKGMAFPKSLDTPEKIIAAWQVAASLGLPPAVAIQNLAVIHGSVSMWGQLPKALVEKTGQLEDFKIIRFDADQKEISFANKNLTSEVFGVVCQMKRKKRSMGEYYFTLDDAKKANLMGKAGPWSSYISIMLMRRAVAMACKFEFPDALMGVSVAEYDHHEAPDLKDVTTSNQDMAKKIEELVKED